MIEPGRREEMELLRRLQEGEDFFKTRGGYFARNSKGENTVTERKRERERWKERDIGVERERPLDSSLQTEFF